MTESTHPAESDVDRVVWYVSQEEWDWLMELLDAPAEVNPKLRELLSRPTVFDVQQSDGSDDHEPDNERGVWCCERHRRELWERSRTVPRNDGSGAAR